jgi:hypothetical protein
MISLINCTQKPFHLQDMRNYVHYERSWGQLEVGLEISAGSQPVSSRTQK